MESHFSVPKSSSHIDKLEFSLMIGAALLKASSPCCLQETFWWGYVPEPIEFFLLCGLDKDWRYKQGPCPKILKNVKKKGIIRIGHSNSACPEEGKESLLLIKCTNCKRDLCLMSLKDVITRLPPHAKWHDFISGLKVCCRMLPLQRSHSVVTLRWPP